MWCAQETCIPKMGEVKNAQWTLLLHDMTVSLDTNTSSI